MSKFDEERRRKRREERLKSSKRKAPPAAPGVVSPLTSRPLDGAQIEQDMREHGLAAEAMRSEAEALNRTYLATEGILTSVSDIAKLLKQRAEKLLNSEAVIDAVDLARCAEAIARANEAATRSMAMLQDMHRIHMRDPIRAAPPPKGSERPVDEANPLRPQKDGPRRLLERLRGLPEPKLGEEPPRLMSPPKEAVIHDYPAVPTPAEPVAKRPSVLSAKRTEQAPAPLPEKKTEAPPTVAPDPVARPTRYVHPTLPAPFPGLPPIVGVPAAK